MTTKTSLVLLALAVPAALFLTALSFEAAVLMVFAAGCVGFALYDYSRPLHSWVAAPATRGAVKRHRARLGLAA